MSDIDRQSKNVSKSISENPREVLNPPYSSDTMAEQYKHETYFPKYQRLSVTLHTFLSKIQEILLLIEAKREK